MMGNGIEIRRYEAADMAACLKLMDLCYGQDAPSDEWWTWRYFGLETSHSEIYLADCDGEIIGMQPMAFFPYTLYGRSFVGALLTGVMVYPGHRRKGVFRALVETCVTAAWCRDADFVTTMPNDRSYPGFLKFGWLDPGDRTLLVQPLDLLAVARSKIRPGWLGSLIAALPQMVVMMTSSRCPPSHLSVRRVDRFDTDADDLAGRLSVSYRGLLLRRDSVWLNWRYVTHPTIDYKRFEARSDERCLRGIATTTLETRTGICVGYIVELIGETSEARRLLISSAVCQLQESGASLVVTVMSDPDGIADLCDQGFYRIPRYLSPKKFHTVYIPHPKKGAFLTPMRQIENWYQTLGDWDVI
jgi:GNAT superfamily N-acetyltransferase